MTVRVPRVAPVLLPSLAVTVLREVQIGVTPGFHDFDFPLASISLNGDGVWEVLGRGTVGKEVVSLLVRFGPDWDFKQFELGELRVAMHGGTVELVSMLGETDAFVRLLDERFKTNLLPAGMRPRVWFRAITLSGNPARLEQERLEMKLFFNSDDQAHYAEFYVNIDVAKGALEFHEKDGNYRKAIVMALAKDEPLRV